MQTPLSLEIKYLYVLSTRTHLHLYVSKAIHCTVHSSFTFYQYLQAWDPDNAKAVSVLKLMEKNVEFCAMDLNMVKCVQQSCKTAEIHTSVSDYQLNINSILLF